MSAEQALFDAYRQWRRLARAGSLAIQKRDWPFLMECHGAVRCLQPSISRLRQQVREQWRQSPTDCSIKEKELNGLILETMEILASNKKLLQAARGVARSEWEKLQQAGRNLRRLRDSYNRPRSSRWSSFS